MEESEGSTYEEYATSIDFEIESRDVDVDVEDDVEKEEEDVEYDDAFFNNLEQEQDNTDTNNDDTFDTSYSFVAKDLNGVSSAHGSSRACGLDEEEFGGRSLSPSKSAEKDKENDANGASQSKHASSSSMLLFQTNTIPFYGRENELALLQQSVARISVEWMENPSEVVWITGTTGVGKSTLVQHASAQGIFWKTMVCRGTCEQHATATHPFQALAACLNDLCRTLQRQGGTSVWKGRLEQALGGEGPLLATLCPRVIPLLQLTKPTMEQRKSSLLTFDANTKHRFARLAFCVRDLLQAVSEYHPLVMIVDNIHWADLDSLQLIQDLLTTKPLKNFVLIACHDPIDHHPGHAVHAVKAVISATMTTEHTSTTNSTRTTDMELMPLELDQVDEVLCSVFLDHGNMDDDDTIDRIQDLGEILHSLSKGNILWTMSLLRLLNDKKLLSYTVQEGGRWDWNRKKIKKEVKAWRDANDPAFDSLEGVITARLEQLPKKIKFVVESIAALRLTSFHVEKLYPVLQAAYQTNNKKGDNKECPIQTQDELESFVVKGCAQGIFKKIKSSDGYYMFSHDIVRECASTLLPSGKRGSSIHLRMGLTLSSLSSMEPNKNKNNKKTKNKREERERFKFLAVDQLNQCVELLDEAERVQLAQLNVEAAEIAITKTAFRTSVEYLEAGMAALDHSVRWEPNYYDVTLRIFLFLARMRHCAGRTEAAKAACDEIFENATTVKDRVYANQVLIVVLLEEGNYAEALQRVLTLLAKMGESFPKENVETILKREIANLRKAVSQKENQQLLNPPKMTDKKSLDVMFLLATLVEISKHYCNKDDGDEPSNTPITRHSYYYQELATIRMMHISLRFGFSRQYPLAFALFAVCLIQMNLVKEAHRMGQVAEKVARLSDFYGAEAVALFHWHVSHWKRTYKRNLEPVLTIYNAQVDAGDFHHVDLSITTYVQYHLASGFDLEKLSDNLQLFDGLYSDYDLPDDWHILIPQQVVANLMGETLYPILFFGDTVNQQDTQIEKMEHDGQHQALEYFYFARLFVAFFFHDIEVMSESLEKLTKPAEGVWIPWRLFLECFILISQLPTTKGKRRKELKDSIESQKGQLIDWYNEGAQNLSAMVSILEAEYVIAKEAEKGLSALKVQEMFNEAIDAAASDGVTHLEAFACERAGLHFHTTGVEGSSAEYLARAHKAYDKWHGVAKVIDIEARFADKLKISTRRQRPGLAYIQQNASMQRTGKLIGGGHGEIKSLTIQKVMQGAKTIRTKSVNGTHKIKGLFAKKEKAEPAPWGWKSKGKMVLGDDGSVSPVRPRSSMFGLQKSPGINEYERTPLTSTKSSKVSKKPLSGLFGKAKPPFADIDGEDEALEKSPSIPSRSSVRFFARVKREKLVDHALNSSLMTSPKEKNRSKLKLFGRKGKKERILLSDNKEEAEDQEETED